MWFRSSLASWKSERSRSPRPARRGTRLVLEHLEDRALPSSYSAGSVADLIADITAANTAGGANTITLTAAITAPYVLTAVNNTTTGTLTYLTYDDYGNTGLPVIAANDNLTILGNADTIERSTAAGTPDFRLFRVASGGSLTLENLTLQGGMIAADGVGRAHFTPYGPNLNGAADGGAIFSQGTLVLTGVIVQDNEAVIHLDSGGLAVAGGGIFSSGGAVTLEGGTIVQNNEAFAVYYYANGSAYGGGLFASGGTVTVTNATLDNNTATAGDSANGSGGNADGGGLCAFGAAVTLTNAALDGNAALPPSPNSGDYGTLDGGGLYLVSYGAPPFTVAGSATLTNCTVQGNSASAGGGLYLDGSATLTNCIVQGNSASAGGGLFITGFGATLEGNTIQSNSATAAGGGLFLAGGGATLQGNSIQYDSAISAGGGIYVQAYTGSYYGSGEDGFGGIVLTGNWLADAITATQTTISLYDDAAIVPGETLVIDSEAMTVTAVNDGNYGLDLTLTVVRGVDGTTAASHAAGASVYPALKLDGFTLANLINNTAPSDPNIDGPYVEPAPTVVNAASANPSPVTGTTTTLSVLGADVAGASLLTYTWAVTSAPAGTATPTFSNNGRNASQNTTATFFQAGTYTFQATITDPSGLTAVSSVTVTVVQTVSSLSLTPGTVTVADGAKQQFTATALDQFGQAMASPPTFTWQVSSVGGTVSKTGLYTAPKKGTGSFQVSVSADGLSAEATVTVVA